MIEGSFKWKIFPQLSNYKANDLGRDEIKIQFSALEGEQMHLIINKLTMFP